MGNFVSAGTYLYCASYRQVLRRISNLYANSSDNEYALIVADSLTIDSGIVINGRYRLIAALGIGYGGQVYLADDIRLRRQVAVRVLRRGYADNAFFLEQFREEAQRATSFNHPNIVSVYDWGEKELPYVVSEYHAGGSLLEMISTAGAISPSQALLVGIEISKGLEYAHKRGVTHLALKPSNIIFDFESKVHIADFGVAKVVASAAELNERPRDMYSSPEQVREGRLDQRSDIFSLAVILYECVTGDLPFREEEIAEPDHSRFEHPLDPDPKVFGSLASPLIQATSIDFRERPSALEFQKLLLEATSSQSRPEPLPISSGLDAGQPVSLRDDPTLIDLIKMPTSDGWLKRLIKKIRERINRWIWLLLMVAVVIAAAGGIYLASQSNEEIIFRAVPEVTGMTVQDFTEEVGDFWELQEALDRLDGTIQGTILRTDPEAGKNLEEGETITYFVSQGPELRPVPVNLIGIKLSDAEALLLGADLTLGEVTEQLNENYPMGIVISVLSSEDQLPTGTPVDVVVSLGPVMRTIPEDLVGLTLEEAQTKLVLEGLQYVLIEVFDEEIPAGIVISVQPEPLTQVIRDTVIELRVSQGPPLGEE